jgi:hypothetical protein
MMNRERAKSTVRSARRRHGGKRVILSFHIADAGPRNAIGVLRSRPDPARVPGLRYAETLLGAPLRAGLLPKRAPGRVALIAAWDSDAALETFIERTPLARSLEHGWQVRLEPVRAWGAWSALPDIARPESPVADDEPVAVLTLGRLRLLRFAPFLAASAPAEREALAHPGVLAATGLARPPRIVATFSVWRTAREMREYALGDQPGGHLRAITAHKRRPFHHESVFVRFRPYAATGSWDGVKLLADERGAAASRSAPV